MIFWDGGDKWNDGGGGRNGLQIEACHQGTIKVRPLSCKRAGETTSRSTCRQFIFSNLATINAKALSVQVGVSWLCRLSRPHLPFNQNTLCFFGHITPFLAKDTRIILFVVKRLEESTDKNVSDTDWGVLIVAYYTVPAQALSPLDKQNRPTLSPNFANHRLTTEFRLTSLDFG
jgi:hypothetical protein